MTEPRDILTTIRPADRIPSVGEQLSIVPEALTCWRCRGWRPRTPCYCADLVEADRLGVSVSGLVEARTIAPTIERRPEPLNLWDQSADSLPETWSAPR